MSRSILVCSPKQDMPPVPGAVSLTADCGHEVWISKSGQQAIKEHNLETRCMACVPTDLPVESLPGIQQEAEQLMGKEAYEMTLAIFRDPAKLNQIMLASRFVTRKKRRWR